MYLRFKQLIPNFPVLNFKFNKRARALKKLFCFAWIISALV